MNRLIAHLVVLPRWFATLAAVTAIIFGGLLVGAGAFDLFVAVLAGLLLMAYAHSWNSYHDWAITGFDKGPAEGRSKIKLYTSGQSLLAQGILSEQEVLANSLVWLILSVPATLYLSLNSTNWVWLVWGLVVLCAPWYSFAKKLWHPDLPLGFGFATCAVWLGMCCVGQPDWDTGFLASLPLFILWGTGAEHVDQGIDYESDWKKGGRSLGLWMKYVGVSFGWSITWLVMLIYLLQVMLISIGILAPWTALTFIAIAPFMVCATAIHTDMRTAIIWGLAAIFLYQTLIAVGQGVANISL